MSYSDPFLAAAREGGVAQPVMVLAPTRDVVSPWIVYGEGCVLDAATLDADGLAMWQATGKVTAVITDLPTPPEPEAPTLSGVTATPDAADGTQWHGHLDHRHRRGQPGPLWRGRQLRLQLGAGTWHGHQPYGEPDGADRCHDLPLRCRERWRQ